MAEETKLLNPPGLSSSLRRRDYHWIEITPEEFANKLADKLRRLSAKTWLLDVYCSNDQVYRNLAMKWNGFGSVKTLDIHFNREEGKAINITLED